MSRKIIQAGPSTLAVSLPMPWVKRFKLKKGQDIEVEEQGNSLKVKTISSIDEDSAIIDVGEFGYLSPKIVGMLYKSGYKKIKAIYTPNKKVSWWGKEMSELDFIKKIFDNFTGMQLWELGKDEDGSYVTIVESAKVNPKEFENVFFKIGYNIIDQAKLVLTYYSVKKELFEEIFLNEVLINKTADFCTRILTTFGHTEYKKTVYYYDLVTKLEYLGDYYFRLGMKYKEDKNKSIFILNYLEKSILIVEKLISNTRKFDKKQLISLSAEINNLRTKLEKEKSLKSAAIFEMNCIFKLIDEIIETILAMNYDSFKD